MRFILPGLFTFYFAALPSEAFASQSQNLEGFIHTLSLKFVLVAGVIITLVVTLTYLFKDLGERTKTVLFILIAIPTLFTTVFLAGSTVYLNAISVTGGPVHWHADLEIYHCGEKIDLVNPKGFSNRIGTATLHEHNDNRIHVEGVVVDPRDINLGNFFRVIGGELTEKSLKVPTTESFLELTQGDKCPDGTEGDLQGFLYKTEGKNIFRHQIFDLPSYILSPHSSVPPGDCIIIEFGKTKVRTSHLCDSYKLQILKGSFTFDGN